MDLAGKIYETGGLRLHARAAGSGSPTVVFEAALGASSLSWALVQPEIARRTRTFAYDRAGFGGSSAGLNPRTAGRIAGELRDLLEAAGLAPPFVLVGHSFGGLCARVFSARYPSDTAGLVLVDAPHPDQWLNPSPEDARRLRMGVRLARRGAFASRIGLAQAVAWLVRAGSYGVARGLSVSFGGPALRGRTDYLLAPLGKLPPDVRRAAAEAWVRPRFYEALASQIESMPESSAEAAAVRDLGPLPLAVVTAANPSPQRLADQAEVLRLSSRARHIVARSGGHWIPLDEPATVVDAIIGVLEQLRR